GVRETIALSAVGGLIAAGLMALSPLRTLREIPALNPRPAAEPATGIPEPTATTSAPPSGTQGRPARALGLGREVGVLAGNRRRRPRHEDCSIAALAGALARHSESPLPDARDHGRT